MSNQRLIPYPLIPLVWSLLVGLGGAALLFHWCSAPAAHAAGLTVTNLNDAGPGSLRQAILDAAPGDTISFASQITGTLTLQSGQLVIDKDLTIVGPGVDWLSLSGASGSRVITVATGANLKLLDLTIRSGNLGSGSTLDIGGAIYNNGHLTATRVAFSNNYAFWTGGALYNGGMAVIDHARIEGNGSAYGGVIANGGLLTVTSSTISGNSVGGGNSSNGVVENLSGATLYLANSTVANNSNAATNGANATIANFGTARLESVTVVGNQHTYNGAALFQDPGATGGLTVHNSIIAGNQRYTGPADCAGALASADYNLIQSPTGCLLPETITGLITDTVSWLSTLGNHGGFAKTMVPAVVSPAVNTGDPADCFALDQRGMPRPNGARCDLGAVEYQAAPTTTLTVTSAAGTGAGSLRATIEAANAFDNFSLTIMFAPQVAGTLSLSSGQIDITRSLAIVGPGADLLTITGAGAHRLFRIDGGADVSLSGLTLSSGNAGSEDGGAIYVLGRLTLTQSRVVGSTAVNGGGIAVASGGRAQIIESLIFDNSATLAGGGMYAMGATMDVLTSTVARNESATGAGGYFVETFTNVSGSSFADNAATNWGGGLVSLTVVNSAIEINATTISRNTAQNAAGLDVTGPAELSNVTFSGNSASGDAGGLYAREGTILLSNVTVTENVADSDANLAGNGGGVWIAGSYTVVTAMNSLIAGNLDLSPSGSFAPDCFGQLSSVGYNLVGQSAGCVLTGTMNGVITGTAPGLAPLQDAGGSTQVHPLLDGSPALNAGNPATPGGIIGGACAPFDQRGVSRPQDGRCDIGAFEGTWRPLNTIQLSGPVVGVVGEVYTFAADVGPITATLPVTYTWSVTGATPVEHTAGLSDTLDLAWSAAGTYTVTVAADNRVAEPIPASRSITIVAGAMTTVPGGSSGTLVYTPTTSGPTTVSIPAGAVTDTTTLVLAEQTAVTPGPGFAFAGHAFTLDAYQAGDVIDGFTFAQPVTVSVGYSDADLNGLDEQSLRLTTWNGSAWVDAATTCSPASTYLRDTVNNRLSVAICHLSDYALFGQHRVWLPLLRH